MPPRKLIQILANANRIKLERCARYIAQRYTQNYTRRGHSRAREILNRSLISKREQWLHTYTYCARARSNSSCPRNPKTSPIGRTVHIHTHTRTKVHCGQQFSCKILRTQNLLALRVHRERKRANCTEAIYLIGSELATNTLSARARLCPPTQTAKAKL